MEIRNLRKGSRGLAGTYENINCHAPNAHLVVSLMVGIIHANADGIQEWAQAHNVHIIKSKDGRMLECRPFQRKGSSSGVDGVEVSYRISRTRREKLFVVHANSIALFAVFLPSFLMLSENDYGTSKKEE